MSFVNPMDGGIRRTAYLVRMKENPHLIDTFFSTTKLRPCFVLFPKLVVPASRCSSLLYKVNSNTVEEE